MLVLYCIKNQAKNFSLDNFLFVRKLHMKKKMVVIGGLYKESDLEQAVRFLPGQKRRFCIPYCMFIFSCNMAADVIFLCSWQIQNGGVTVPMIAGAVFFALQSAVLSVLLEWFYPIRGWKIESDLWHHPRKYVVPVVMLLPAGAASAWPMLLYVLLVLLAVEIVILLFIPRGHS